ncbi:uncharacterized protein N7479_001929 [Penicillium vulpinum]|uniref:UDP-N-acetylglucosamine transferase subunit ALG13 n=1 Tax=Penicillium vulpinum TaxID=29845 RepID=A0A1V6S434_9EURO|nr:uncharacterized protein N7479_001929 [Penicillium vulpinum]KAJ5972011.1 hypothetical protein N7479_001929 [Penicillium vulpinum]OQE08815.1 hypothetical protein PENVUL_c008G07136 [Penicillium vulpinum]
MKLCFVTVGATASFHKLLEQVLSSEFLEILAKRHYTHLLIQYGKDGQQIFQNFIDSGQPHHGLTLGGFDFQPSIDAQMMMTVEREVVHQERGLIICHAGSGTVLAGLRLGVPLIVVPNPDLADNHQQELADELEEGNYVISSSVKDLGSAISRAETQKSEVLSIRTGTTTLAESMSDELSFLD